MKKRLLLLFFAVVIVALIFGAFSLYNLPLGKALELKVPQEIRQPAAQQGNQSQQDPPQKTCGDSGVMKLIVLGQASPMDKGHYGADAIRMVWVDFDNSAVSVLALPSDLWVDAAALEEPGMGSLSLNEIYQVAYQAASSSNSEVLTRKATQVLAQTLVDNFAFVPDHYVTVREEAFVDLVDTAELEIDVPYDILVVPEGWHTFEAGLQTMDGDQALDYVRILLPPDSGQTYAAFWDRFERQNQVLFAMLESALQPKNWDQIPELVKTARKMVVTDLSVNQADNLACMLKEASEQMDLIQLPQDLVSQDEQGHLVVDPEEVKDLIAEIETQ
jgi:anionic cell wall polymer biosynthesis LytR-Cps2A-Psr (LCP) family protein